MTKHSHLGAEQRRHFTLALLAAVAAPRAIGKSSKTEAHKTMTTLQMTLWQLLDAIGQQLPLSRPRLEALLSTALAEFVEPSNDVFRFFKAPPVRLLDGLLVAQTELRLKREGAHPGLLLLQIEDACVTLEAVRHHMGPLEITGVPRGRSLYERTWHTASRPWADVSFGFKELQPACLSDISIEPKLTR